MVTSRLARTWFGATALVVLLGLIVQVSATSDPNPNALFPMTGVFTLIRGHAIGFYPYAFMNPTESGDARVTINLVIIAAIFVGMAASAHRLDRSLKDRCGSPSTA